MGVILLGLASVTSLGLLGMLIDFVVGHRQLRFLSDIPPAPAGPTVSVIVAARNEAAGVEAGLRSLQHLDYPNLEIIVVDDRSTDGPATSLIAWRPPMNAWRSCMCATSLENGSVRITRSSWARRARQESSCSSPTRTSCSSRPPFAVRSPS